MSGWIDVAVVLVVVIAGMILAVRDFGWKKRYGQLSLHMSIIQKENDTLKEQSNRVVTLKAERDVSIFQSKQALAQLEDVASNLVTCINERDALQLKLDEALKPKTRASRAKPKEVP